MASYKQNLCIISLVILIFFFIPIRINTVEKDFDLYLARYNKSYNTTEYRRRLEIFRKSQTIIHFLNNDPQDNLSAVYGLTEFTDLIPDIFLANLYKKYMYPVKQKPVIWSPDLNIPIKVDWRDKKVVNNVNNQKSCGACWAFTTIENIETMNALKTGKLGRLSVQQMIDCSIVNNGCDGGDTCILLQWIKINNVSILNEEDYPLRLVTESCRVKNTTKGINIKSFKCENLQNNEVIILQYLANIGPVIAAVNAAPWHYYLDGIIRYHCDGSIKHLNHAVQIVGYDMSDRIPYYIVRNSWGENFGEDGYLKIAIGHNICGIANKIVTVFV